jgi:hypothetical protein
VIDALGACRAPKWRILLGHVFGFNRNLARLFHRGSTYVPARNGDDATALPGAASRRRAEAFRRLSREHDRPHRLMLPPGRVAHIVLGERGTNPPPGVPSGGCCGEPRWHRAMWVPNASFDRIKIAPRMFLDHLPDTVVKVLSTVTAQALLHRRALPPSPPTPPLVVAAASQAQPRRTTGTEQARPIAASEAPKNADEGDDSDSVFQTARDDTSISVVLE